MKALKTTLAASFVAGALALGSAPAHAQCAYTIGSCGGAVSGGISSSTAWWIMACPAGVVTAALAKNWRRHAELTAPEAWTCGLQYWWNEATGQYDRRPARRHRRP
jgi:hypothetical protein